MALPTLNENSSFAQTELLSGKKIGIKPWRVKEERELLFAIEGIDSADDGKKEIIKFIRKCVDSESIFDNLSNTDYVYLLMQLRKVSKGSNIEYSYTCENCKMDLSDDINIDKNMKVVKFKPQTIDVTKDLKVSTKEVSFRDYDKLQTKYKKTTEYNFYYIIASIDSLVIRGEVFEGCTEQEIIDCLDELGSNDFAKIAKAVDASAAEVTLEKKLKCGKCKHENTVNFGDLYSFLAF
jgi:T4 bacteriophage base plate protein